MLWRRRYYHRFTLAELQIRREKRALIVQRALRLFEAMEGSALPGA